ncbi:RICIN domain-containing protein [Pedobacter sp. PAMC26386]|nr:RICIN domain-containing protein [Pedobacter sp. PAMC26386]
MKTKLFTPTAIKLWVAVLVAASTLSSCKKSISSENNLPNAASESGVKAEAYYPKTSGKAIQAFYRGNLVDLVEIDNGKYLFEGDVVLNRKDISMPGEPRTESTVDGNIWTGNRVYFKFAKGIPDNLKTMWATATKMWTDAGLGLQFIAIDSTDTTHPDYIELTQNSDGSAFTAGIGKVGGRLELSIDPTSGWTAGNVAHEIGHALGLQHEQTRSDRDLFTVVNTSTLTANWKYQYLIKSNAIGVGPFDYGSIMMYPSKKGVLTKLDGTGWPYNRANLTQTDILGINYKYNITTYTANGIYEIEAKHAVGSDLQVDSANQVTIAVDSNNLNQKWEIKHARDGYYKITPQNAKTLQLAKNLDSVQVKTADASDSQLWRIVPTYNAGYFRFINKADSKSSLDVEIENDGTSLDHARTKIAAFTIEEPQQWKLKKVQ